MSLQSAPSELDAAKDQGVSNGVSPAWYAVQVKRFCERRVLHHLTMKSIPAFLPLIECTRRHRSTRRLTRLEPLFPGYVLVRLRSPEHSPAGWQAVRWGPGVRRILGTDEVPTPVPDEAVTAIQRRVKDLGYVRPGLRFPEGSRVRLRCGPFAGLEAVFDCQVSRNGRVRVLLELLGQVRRAEVDELDLESA